MSASNRGGYVRVPRWQLWLIATAAVLSVLALAFLTGYEAAHWNTRTTKAEPVGGEAAAVPVAPLSRAPEAPPSAPPQAGPAALPPIDAGQPAAATSAMTSATPVGSPASAAGVTRAEVAAYFAATDAILESAKQNGDPNTLAQKILEQAVSGDSAGLDHMVAAQRSLAARLSGMRVPAPCAEHHRRTLALLAKGADLLQQAGSAIRGGDTNGLAALAMGGQQIEGEARALDALATTIRGQYGLR